MPIRNIELESSEKNKLFRERLHKQERKELIFTRNITHKKPIIPPFYTDFTYCCKQGQYQKVKSMVTSNKALVHEKNRCQNSGLHLAIDNGHMEIVKLLLENGANPDMEGYKGRTAKQMAKSASMLNLLDKY